MSDEFYDVEPPYAVDGWHSLASARANWLTGAPSDDWILESLLNAAKDACLAYLPDWTFVNARPISDGMRLAQIMQARNILNASKTDPGQSADGDLFVIRPFPLDRWVTGLLRPKRAVPRVG